MNTLLLFILFNVINNQKLINISSFESFTISKDQKEFIFKYNYYSNEKTDILMYFSPIENKIFGKLLISTSLDKVKTKEAEEISENEKLVDLKFSSKSSITINAKEKVNKGKGYYYLLLKGDIYCEFEIFLSNEIRNLSLSNSYYFPKVYNLSLNFLTFNIDNLEYNYYLNILKNNRTCSDLEIFDGNDKIKCEDEIPEFIQLTQGYNYSIKIYYNNTNDDCILNFVESKIQDLSTYKNNLFLLQNSVYFFQYNIEYLGIYEQVTLEIDNELETNIKIYYMENKINIYELPDESSINSLEYNNYNQQNIIILKRNNLLYKFILMKINNNKNTIFPVKINILNNIYKIYDIPYIFDIKEKNNYLFVISEELKEYYTDIENFFIFKYDFKNAMKIYSLNNKVNKDKIYIEELKNIMYICFNNNTNSGIFKIDILPHIMNNKLRFSSNFNELSYSFIEKKK